MSAPETSMARSDDVAARKYRLRFRTAAELFEAFPKAREDMRAKATEQDCLTVVRALAAGATPEEGITFAAYLLPPREAVWWAHQCLSYVPDALSETDQDMLALAEAWVRDPRDEPRNAALEAAHAAETESPGVWLAFATGWSSGSMGPPGMAPVPPPPFLTPRAVNAAVLGILARVDTQHRDAVLGGFVEMAIKLTEA